MNEHNHELDLENIRFFSLFRKITPPNKSQIQVLDASGVQPSKIFSVFGKKAGGIGNTRCTEMDCRNFIGSYGGELLSTDGARIF